MTDYPAYERMQEYAALGDHVTNCMNSIIAGFASGDRTLASLQRFASKYTDAGITISFQLDDGTYVWPGDKQAFDPTLVDRVRKIGFSSIVEGSDAEVPLRWLDLLDDAIESSDEAFEYYELYTQETNDEACRIWDEEHSEDED